MARSRVPTIVEIETEINIPLTSASFNSHFGGLYDRKKQTKLEGPKDENDNTRVQTLNDFMELGAPNSMSIKIKSEGNEIIIDRDFWNNHLPSFQGVTRVRFSGRYKIEIESTHYRRDRDRDRDYNLP